jgi:ABC-2 type transport system ATP-binding protein
MIELVDLTKRFDDFLAVDRASFSVRAGEILALLGPNGAGKTTTVRMLAGILRPTAGQACVAGYSVTEEAREVRRRVGLLTERPGLYLRMYGSEYLDFFGRLMGLDSRRTMQRARQLLESFGMAEAWDRRIGTFSKGMRQKMALTRAMLHDPPVLLLDEPTSAMDPQSAKLVRDAVLSLRDGQRAVMICTHNLAEAEALADRIAIIRRGRIAALGTPEQLKAELLGPPLMEVRLATPCDGVAGLITDLVKVQSQGADWLRYTISDPRTGNPRVIRTLASQGVEVVTVSEVARSLEDVYLWAVEG